MKQTKFLKLVLVYLFLINCLLMGFGAEETRVTLPAAVKVAVVHFKPELGNVTANVNQLLLLTTEAAGNGAKLIVHTEMATCGYSYFSRSGIAQVAETIPGPITKKFSRLAAELKVYIVFGMAECDKASNLYYNTAVLINPEGKIMGKYRKRNNLIEAAYNAIVYDSIPVFKTPFGRIALLICADFIYPHFTRAAVLAGADILVVPANVGITADFVKVRAIENNVSVIIANRFGEEITAAPEDVFNQNTFTITSPFTYNFNYDARSIVMSNTGNVLCEVTGEAIEIGYAELRVPAKHHFPVKRRPEMYSLIAQDTLHTYTFEQTGLPQAARFYAAALDPGTGTDPWATALAAIENTIEEARVAGYNLKLLVLPAGYFNLPADIDADKIREICTLNEVDIILHFGKTLPPSSLLFTYSGTEYTYNRTHKGINESFPENTLSSEFIVIDRPYARLTMLHDQDLLAPETAIVMAKMGVDLIAVNSSADINLLSPLYQDRTGRYLHILSANSGGSEGMYYGGYRVYPMYNEAEGLVMMEINTSHVRPKKEPRFFDSAILLK